MKIELGTAWATRLRSVGLGQLWDRGVRGLSVTAVVETRLRG